MLKSAKLWNQNFALLWQGHFISQIGTQILVVAQVLWIKEEARLATLVGLTSILWTAGCIISGPLGGSFADSHDRKRILIVCDCIAGSLSLLVFLFFFLFPGSFEAVYILISFTSFINGIVFSFMNPAVQAALPDLVPHERLQQANALKNSTHQVSQLSGQALGPVIFRFFGAPILYLIDGLTFLFSGASIVFIRAPKKKTDKKHATLADGVRLHWDNTKEGLRYLAREPGLNLMVLTYCAMNFCAAPMMVLLPFFVDQNLHLTAEWYGFLMAAFGVGIITGYAVSGLIRLAPRSRSFSWGAAMIVMSVLGVIGFNISDVWIILLLFFAAGIASGFTNIIFITSFQKRTPENLRGRLFGVLGAISMGLMPVGIAIAGAVNDLWPHHVREILTASFALMLVATAAVFPNRKVREYLSWEGAGKKADEKQGT